MQVVHELSRSFPFALPSAYRTFLYPQGSADTFPSPPSEVYTLAHGVYTMFETHLQVSCRYAVHTLCTFLSLELA